MYWLRSLFQPKAQTPGAHTLHFRLILCDVERALLHLQELVHKQEQQDAESGDDNEATPQAKAGMHCKRFFFCILIVSQFCH